MILRPPLYSMSPSFLNLFMKKFTRDARRADHFRERLLGDLRQRSLRIGLAVARQQEQRPGEPLFAGVEELIDEVRFDADVPRQHVGDEAVRERGLARGAAGSSTPSRWSARCSPPPRSRFRCEPIWPARTPSPKKSPGTSIATTASLPMWDSTESLTAPFWRYLTSLPGSPCEKMTSRRRYATTVPRPACRIEIRFHIEPAGLPLDRWCLSFHAIGQVIAAGPTRR